jgi:centrosomal protein CEP76
MSNDVPALTAERIADTRRAIHQHLQQSNVYGQIRSILAAYAADHDDFDIHSPNDVMKVLKERGVVQQVLGAVGDAPQRSVALGGPLAAGPGGAVGSGSASRGRDGASHTALYLRLAGGRAFLDNFDAAVVEARRKAKEQMVVHLHFGNQRFRSAPLPVSCDPAFDDDFLINIEPSIRDLIECQTPLHILVTSEDASGAKCRTVGENTIEWRRVLRRGVLNVAVELAGVNPGVPAGILDVQLELLPFGRPYAEDEIQFHLEQTKSGQSAADREFLVYARRWWGEYQAMRSSHAQRRVKVFAQALSGRMLPVTHYIDVLQPDRVFDGPEDAARFVSLFSVDSPGDDTANDMLSGLRAGPGEQWLSTFTFLCQRRGDSPNHATLLCSLLLGFGLDAYCVVGAGIPPGEDAAGPRPIKPECPTTMLVLTRQALAQAAESANIGTRFLVRLWDPTEGTVFDVNDVAGHRLLTIDCAFNNRQLVANVQDANRVETTQFDFEDETRWKSVNPMKLRMVPRVSPCPPLLWVPTRPRQLEVELEQRLKKAVVAHRDTISVPTLWDDDLAVVFNQALSKYEAARRDASMPVDLTWFSHGVKGKLGEGRTFKGFPVNVTHTSEARILAAILCSTTGKLICECAHDETYLALRCKVWAFPEGVVSVWVMIGARYRARMA